MQEMWNASFATLNKIFWGGGRGLEEGEPDTVDASASWKGVSCICILSRDKECLLLERLQIIRRTMGNSN